MIVFNLLFGVLITFIVAACYIIMIAFTVWMLIDAGKQDRFWWLALIIGVPVIGAAVYYFTEKKHEYRQAPVHYVHASETEQQHEKVPKKKVSRKVKKEEKEIEFVKGTQTVESKEIVQNPEIAEEETKQV